jgi:transmembrane sensor
MSTVNEASCAQSDHRTQNIEDQAMRWLLELNGSDAGADRWQAFAVWLSQDPDHEDIYCRFEQTLWRLQKQCLAKQARDRLQQIFDESSALARQAVEARVMPTLSEWLRPLGAWVLCVAAIAAMLTAGGALYYSERQHPFIDTVLTTAANPSTTRKLDNGVMVLLGAHTTLRMERAQRGRRVLLVEGEAIFDVPEKLTEPFVVSASVVDASASARAKFAVAIDDSVSIYVHEGVIEVRASGAPRSAPAIVLERGASYRVTVDGRRPAIARVDTRGRAKPVAG